MSRPHKRPRGHPGEVIPYANARRGRVRLEPQPAKHMKEEDARFEAKPAPATTDISALVGLILGVEVGEELGVERLRVNGVVVDRVVVQAEVFVGDAGDLAPVECLKEVCVPRVR